MPKPLWAPWRLEYVEQADERAGCIFCTPEDDLLLRRETLAFAVLNRYPYASGHLMVAPVRHLADFGALTDAEATAVHRIAAEALRALDAEYRPQGYNLGWNLGRVAGAGIVDHVHLHLVPRWVGDTNFMPVLADVKSIPEALAETARRLRARLSERPRP